MKTKVINATITYSRAALGLFLIVTLGLVFIIGGLIITLEIQLNSPAYYALYVMGLMSPFLGSMAYFWATTKSFKGVREMFLPFRFGGDAPMVLALPVSLVTAYIVFAQFGFPVNWNLLPPVSSLLISCLGWSSIIWLEETGWRGTLLPVLQLRFTPLVATFLINIVWVLWHLPLLYMIRMNGIELGLFTAQTFGIALVMTWAYNRSKTVLTAIFIHGAYNGTSIWLLATLPSMTTNELIGVQAAGPVVLGMLVLFLTKGRLGFQSKSHK